MANNDMDYNYDEDDDIITLTAANGEQIDFVEIAGIKYKNAFYAIMQPVELLDGMDDDEALVFKVTKENGEDKFEIELDDKIIDGVFAEYDRILDEANGNGGNKKIKKSSGKNKVFGATRAIAKTTTKIIKSIFFIIIFLTALVFFIAACVELPGAFTAFDIFTIIVCAIIGIISFLIGKWSLKHIIKIFKK